MLKQVGLQVEARVLFRAVTCSPYSPALADSNAALWYSMSTMAPCGKACMGISYAHLPGSFQVWAWVLAVAVAVAVVWKMERGRCWMSARCHQARTASTCVQGAHRDGND
jgi:hypothetical protein